jgi:predicted Rossmann fold flavoprotein
VKVLTHVDVERVERGGDFAVVAGDREWHASALVVATGGLSIPKMGATRFGYDLARQFGLEIVATRPGLVPLVFNEEDRKNYCDLSGLSADVITSIGKQSFREKMLITHRGLSGPAVLQISSYWKTAEAISIDLVPQGEAFTRLLQTASGRDLNAAKDLLRSVLPQRLADRWLDLHIPKGWTNHAIAELECETHNWQVVPEGTEGYAKAEVTVGGVDTNELSAKTMESRKVPGLFFIGEVVDVTGHLGGFNFQWAWSSGFSAGNAV